MKKSFLALSLLAGLVSCKKNDPAPTDACTANSASITGTYKITSVKYKLSSSATATDSFTGQPDCLKDDTYELKVDGSLVNTDAGISCGLPPAPGSGGSWSLESNNTILKLSGLDLIIESFDCTSLVLYQENVSLPGDRRTTTYVKQ